MSKLEKRLSSEFYFIVLLPLFYDIETMMSKLEKKLSSEFHFTVPLLYDIETTMSKLEKRLSSDFWFPFHSSAFTSQWYRNQGDEQAWEETVLKSSASQSHLTSLSLSPSMARKMWWAGCRRVHGSTFKTLSISLWVPLHRYTWTLAEAGNHDEQSLRRAVSKFHFTGTPEVLSPKTALAKCHRTVHSSTLKQSSHHSTFCTMWMKQGNAESYSGVKFGVSL